MFRWVLKLYIPGQFLKMTLFFFIFYLFTCFAIIILAKLAYLTFISDVFHGKFRLDFGKTNNLIETFVKTSFILSYSQLKLEELFK